MFKFRFVVIPLIILVIVGLVVFVPEVRTALTGAGDWVFGSPKALEVGYYYTCPMVAHSSVRSSGPGACPLCGMTLIKKKAGAEEQRTSRITLTDRQIQIGGVRTEVIRKRNLVKVIEAIGKIDYDERLLYHISNRIDGRVDKLYVNFTGMTISSSHALVALYSPQLVSAQKEYLLSLDTLKTIKTSQFPETVKAAEELVQSTRRRLLLWGITEEQVKKLEETREVTDHLTIYPPAGGTVIKKNIIEGGYVKEGDILFEIADLSTVWLYADIYEPDIPLLMEQRGDDYYQCPMHPEVKQDAAGVCPVEGCRMPLVRHSPSLLAEVTTRAFPGEVFTGQVEFTYPFVNPETRTLRIRISIPNTDLKLRPEMFARAKIKITEEDKLSIPESAVVYTGKRNIVFISESSGTFSPRLVSLGAQWLYDQEISVSEEVGLPFHRGMQRYHEVLDGVKEGEAIVTTGNFLVDAESQIQGAMEQFLSGTEGKETLPEPTHPPGHKH